MTCLSPMKIKTFDGYVEVPCRKCIKCRLHYSAEWAVRLMHEAQYHKYSSFVTLTYLDIFNPGELSKDVLVRFKKRLSKNLKSPLKYFACGEYGDDGYKYGTPFGRPHYHLAIFGFSPYSLEHFDILKKSWPYQDYDMLERKKIVEPLCFENAQYIAKYVLKKYSGSLAEEYYGEYQKPFVLMSKGLGKQYCLDHLNELQDMDCCYVGTGKNLISLPRYYKKLIEKSDVGYEPSNRQGFSEDKSSIDILIDRNKERKKIVEKYGSLENYRKLSENYISQKNRLYNGGLKI